VEGAPPEGGQDVVLLGQPSQSGTPLPEGAVLALEVGPQGGQHVMIAVRQYSSAVATWVYEVGFEQAPPAAGAAPESPTIHGSNSVPVETCASGWTETTMPVFIHFTYGTSSPSPAGEVKRFQGVLRVVARNRDSEGKLTAEMPVEIQR
jgi:hypothetical protein